MKVFKSIVVDDHALFRMGISGALKAEENVEVIDEAASAIELLELLERKEDADLIFLDIIMPGMTGLEAARIIKKKYPEIKILLLSAETSKESINEALDIGVDGFISKSDAPNEIGRAIHSIKNGEPFYGQVISKIMYEILIAERCIGPMKTEDNTSMFSDREIEIIQACSEGLTAKETAEALFISKRTVDWHRSNIFGKLGIKNNIELVKYALKHGIIQW
jgi:DNA-binding NarL/FixJ family response regulator